MINITQVVDGFIDSLVLEKGEHCYAFAFQLPAWLPESMLLLESINSVRMGIRYKLKAEVELLDTSLDGFSATVPIYVRRKDERGPVKTAKEVYNGYAGGCCRIGSEPFSSIINFAKNEYKQGEMASVSVNCDNRRCSKEILNIDFYL